jgi:catechol 2,3-dioxygenase-like lactoylglutathione lyase family enzyme
MNWRVLAALGVALCVGAISAYLAFRLSSPGPTTGQMRLNHVGINVANFDEALDFYTKKMGYRRAFAIPDAPGQPRAVYLQVSRETFVELLEATSARPAGFIHVGFEVNDMSAAIAKLKALNVKVAQSRVGRTKATVAEVEVPDGVNVELLEFGPDSMQRKAMEYWTP